MGRLLSHHVASVGNLPKDREDSAEQVSFVGEGIAADQAIQSRTPSFIVDTPPFGESFYSRIATT